jgi:hypothetical protein
MDFDRLKAEIKEISEIAQSVPEQFRDRCFDLLLSNLLNGEGRSDSRARRRDAEDGTDKGGATKDEGLKFGATAGKHSKIPITTQVRVLMKKTGVTEEQLETILLYDNGEVHFIKEPKPKGITTGQMEWALMLALKNAILNDSLSTDPEEVRSVCQDKGYYDKGNFSGVFKSAKNAKMFKKALVSQGPAQPLSNNGQDALGDLIKRLAAGESE